MEWLSELGRRLLMLVRRKQFDRDLEEEICLHRELREQEQLEAGVAPEEARYAARRRFGNDLVLREESREMWGWNSVETLIQDVRYGLRQLRRSPAPRCWCHLEWGSTRAAGHSRESGNPVRRQHISKGLRSRFLPPWRDGNDQVSQMTPIPAPISD